MVIPIAVLDPVVAQAEYGAINTTNIDKSSTKPRFVSTIQLLHVKTGRLLGIPHCKDVNSLCVQNPVLIPSAQCTQRSSSPWGTDTDGENNNGGNPFVTLGNRSKKGKNMGADGGFRGSDNRGNVFRTFQNDKNDQTSSGSSGSNSQPYNPNRFAKYETIFDLDSHYVNDDTYLSLWNSFQNQDSRIPMYKDDMSTIQLPSVANILQQSRNYVPTSWNGETKGAKNEKQAQNEPNFPTFAQNEPNFPTFAQNPPKQVSTFSELWDPANAFNMGSFIDDFISSSSNTSEDNTSPTNPLFGNKELTNMRDVMMNSQFSGFFNQSSAITSGSGESSIIDKLTPGSMGIGGQSGQIDNVRKEIDNLNKNNPNYPLNQPITDPQTSSKENDPTAPLPTTPTGKAFISLRLRPMNEFNADPILITTCKGVITNVVSTASDTNDENGELTYNEEVVNTFGAGKRGGSAHDLKKNVIGKLKQFQQDKQNMERQSRRSNQRRKINKQGIFTYTLPVNQGNFESQKYYRRNGSLENYKNFERKYNQILEKYANKKNYDETLGEKTTPQNPSLNSSPNSSFKTFQSSSTSSFLSSSTLLPCTLTTAADGSVTCTSSLSLSSPCPTPQPVTSSALWALTRVPFNDVPTSSLFLSQSVSALNYDTSYTSTNTYPFMYSHLAMRNYSPFDQFLSSRSAKRFFTSFTFRIGGSITPGILIIGDGFPLIDLGPLITLVNSIVQPLVGILQNIFPDLGIPNIPEIPIPDPVSIITLSALEFSLPIVLGAATTITHDNECSASYSIVSPPRTFMLGKAMVVFGRSNVPFEILLQRDIYNPYTNYDYNSSYGGVGGYNGPSSYQYSVPAIYDGTNMINNEYLIDTLS
jgi:hypothetical protein